MLKQASPVVRIPKPQRSGPVDFEEFCALIADGQKADLIDGVIYMASPDNTEAGELFGWIYRLVGDFVDYHDLGKTYGSRIAFRLSDKNSPEPDIAVVLTGNLKRVEYGFVRGPADLAIEIVSPDSVKRDYEQKRMLYEKFGVPEYWIIDEELERVTLLRLGPKGYTEARPRKGVLTSHVVPGLWFRTAWFWQATRPRKTDALAEILAGPAR